MCLPARKPQRGSQEKIIYLDTSGSTRGVRRFAGPNMQIIPWINLSCCTVDIRYTATRLGGYESVNSLNRDAATASNIQTVEKHSWEEQ